MADIVRLAIVYDTQQASANLVGLNRQLGVSTTSARKAGLAALALAQGFEAGSISAVGMASNLGRLSNFLIGPWGLAIGFAAAGLTFFLNRQTKNREEAQKFADQLRDVRRSVDQLLSGKGKTAFESEVEHLSDLITELDRKIQEANTSWTTMLRGGFAAALMNIPGLGAIGQALLPQAPPESEQARRLREQRERLAREGPFPAIRERSSIERRNAEALSRLTGGGTIERLGIQAAASRKQLEELIEAGLDPLSAEAKSLGAGVSQLEEQMRRAQRASDLLQGGLTTMADAIEDFVVTGTLAFTDFLDSIIRMLYRDFTGELIHGVVRSASGGGGNHGSGGIIESGPGSVNPSVQTNVNFTIQAMDTQSGAQWIQRNAPQIAAEIGAQAARSRGLRKMLTSG